LNSFLDATDGRRPANKKRQKANEDNPTYNANERQAKTKPRSFISPASFNSQKEFNTPKQSRQHRPSHANRGGKQASQHRAKFDDNRNWREFFANKPHYRRGQLISAFTSRRDSDPYSLELAQMNIFENQIIPVGIHNLSKSFRPNLSTIRVLSLGMKFIPRSEVPKWKHVFSKFQDFKRRMNNKMFFFVEKYP